MSNANEKTFQERDRLERKPLVDKVCYLVDNLPEDDRFCLALNGAWGSGKTFVLNMLEEEFSKHEEYFVVKYNAWKNSFYHDPLIAILYSIIDSVKEQLDLAEDKKRKSERVLKKLSNDFKKVWNAEIKDRLLNTKEFRAAYMGYCFVRYLYELTKVAKFDLHKHQKFEDFVSYQSLLNDIQKVLNEFTGYQFCVGKQTKLIILVDEIDRCLPNEQLVILERLHHLFDIKNCAVIVAINKNTIISVLQTQQGCDGKEYLKKFFQHNFYVSTQWQKMLNKGLVDVVEFIGNGRNINICITEEEISFLSQYIAGIYAKQEYTRSIKKNMESRSIVEYLTKVKEVLINIDEEINVCYLWLVCVLMFYRTNYGHEYSTLQAGKEQRIFDDAFVNPVKDFNLLGGITCVYEGYVQEQHYRCTCYRNDTLNQINYLYNYVRTRTSDKAAFLEDLFKNRMSLKVEWGKDIVDRIIQIIGNYSE